jgi:hypothetical protein
MSHYLSVHLVLFITEPVKWVNDHGQDYNFSVDRNVHINNHTSPFLRFELRLV